jgi:hypothetical protein
MTELGHPFDPADPNGERTSTVMMRTSDLLPLADTRGGVQLADREGVFAHSFKCHAARCISCSSHGRCRAIPHERSGAQNAGTPARSCTGSPC